MRAWTETQDVTFGFAAENFGFGGGIEACPEIAADVEEEVSLGFGAQRAWVKWNLRRGLSEQSGRIDWGRCTCLCN